MGAACSSMTSCRGNTSAALVLIFFVCPQPLELWVLGHPGTGHLESTIIECTCSTEGRQPWHLLRDGGQLCLNLCAAQLLRFLECFTSSTPRTPARCCKVYKYRGRPCCRPSESSDQQRSREEK